MKDSLAILSVRVAADLPDLGPFICTVIRLSGQLGEEARSRSFTRLRAVLKGFEESRLTGADAFAALKVQVDDLTDQV